jgi:hypothetical protein
MFYFNVIPPVPHAKDKIESYFVSPLVLAIIRSCILAYTFAIMVATIIEYHEVTTMFYGFLTILSYYCLIIYFMVNSNINKNSIFILTWLIDPYRLFRNIRLEKANSIRKLSKIKFINNRILPLYAYGLLNGNYFILDNGYSLRGPFYWGKGLG